MKKYISVLKRTKLFAGVGDDEIASMISCLGAKPCTYKKGEYVLRQGEHLSDIIVLIEGAFISRQMIIGAIAASLEKSA